jgi:hypothetical protein
VGSDNLANIAFSKPLEQENKTSFKEEFGSKLLCPKDLSNLNRASTMVMRLQSGHFRFVYTFKSGYELIGVVEGDYLTRAPEAIFNLRSLKAVCLDAQSNLIMSFDRVFGQFTTVHSEALFSGSKTGQESFFSFNYRDAEACIYDAVADIWITSGWEPKRWRVEELTARVSKPTLPKRISPLWTTVAIA